MKFELGSRKKSRDLHIRKVSFSGSSVSSGSFSSTSSSSTARESHAPPRLHERPFIALDGRRYQDLPAFCDDSDEDDDLAADYAPRLLPNQRRRRYHPAEPASRIASDAHMDPAMHLDMSLACPGAPVEVDGSLFDLHFALAKRPAMPSSRWSESTIATLQTLGGDDDDDDDVFGPATAASSAPSAAEPAERAAATLRPGMKHTDTFEHFVKKGGWKRRGIVFHSDDMAGALGY